MASNGEVTHSSNFRWLSRKSHSTDKVSAPEGLPKSNIVLPGFRNNFLSGDSTSSGCVVVRNDIKRSVSSESESISSSSRQSSVDSYSSSTSADGTSSSDLFASSSSSPCRSVPSSPSGPKFKLIHEGDIQVCRLNHSRTVINKILSSKFLRRWENHHLLLTKTQINSKTVSSFDFFPCEVYSYLSYLPLYIHICHICHTYPCNGNLKLPPREIFFVL